MEKQLLLNDLSKAIQQLENALKVPDTNDLIRAGCIQYFEFCFELSWKTIKACAEEQGLTDCLSPRSAFRRAFSLGWIDDEDVWLDMLSSRNLMSHTYSIFDANNIYSSLSKYLNAFQSLVIKLFATCSSEP